MGKLDDSFLSKGGYQIAREATTAMSKIEDVTVFPIDPLINTVRIVCYLLLE
jgi:hypothetical protein